VCSALRLEVLDWLKQVLLGRLPGGFKFDVESGQREACGIVIWKNILGRGTNS
jgi:hypothetical protein